MPSSHKSTEYLNDAVQGSEPVFVAGATGFVGREVVQQLAALGASVVAHIRPDSGQIAMWRARFAAASERIAVDTTPWEPEALTSTLVALKPSTVYFLIGTTRHAAKRAGVPGNIYQAIDVALCRMLANAAAKATEAANSPKPRFVLLSSVGAGPSGNAYLQARQDMEDSVRAAGLAATVFRPSVITGDRDEARLAESAAATIGDGLLAAVGLFAPRLRARYRSISPTVLARQLVAARGDVSPWRVVEAEAIARAS